MTRSNKPGQPVRPRMFLDVDGVLNAPRAGEIWGEVRKITVTFSRGAGYKERYTLTIGLGLIDALEDLKDRLDIVWATTWCEDDAIHTLTHKLGRLRGNRALPYPRRQAVDGTRNGLTPLFWKRDALATDLRENGPVPGFIWADDEFALAGIAPVLKEFETSSLLIKPVADYGLTPEHLGIWASSPRSWRT